MSTATVLVSVALALLFLATAAGKLTGHAASLGIRDHLAIAAVRWQQIGLLEVAGAVGVLIGLAMRPLGIALPAFVALALAAAALVLQGTDA
jgi:hypothetical protein